MSESIGRERLTVERARADEIRKGQQVLVDSATNYVQSAVQQVVMGEMRVRLNGAPITYRLDAPLWRVVQLPEPATEDGSLDQALGMANDFAAEIADLTRALREIFQQAHSVGNAWIRNRARVALDAVRELPEPATESGVVAALQDILDQMPAREDRDAEHWKSAALAAWGIAEDALSGAVRELPEPVGDELPQSGEHEYKLGSYGKCVRCGYRPVGPAEPVGEAATERRKGLDGAVIHSAIFDPGRYVDRDLNWRGMENMLEPTIEWQTRAVFHVIAEPVREPVGEPTAAFGPNRAIRKAAQEYVDYLRDTNRYLSDPVRTNANEGWALSIESALAASRSVEPEGEAERDCPHCGKLILVPGRNYEIAPSAVCRCPTKAESRSILRMKAHTTGTCPICSQAVPGHAEGDA